MTPPPPMQRETVGLSLEAVLTVTLVRRLRYDLRRRRPPGNEGRQPFHIAVVASSGCAVLRMAIETLLLARREELRVAWQIGLRVTWTEGWLFTSPRQTSRLVVRLVAHVVARLISPIHAAVAAEERRDLTELFLR